MWPYPFGTEGVDGLLHGIDVKEGILHGIAYELRIHQFSGRYKDDDAYLFKLATVKCAATLLKLMRENVG